MAKGIKDKVAILGMGCSKFGERCDADTDQLMVEAYQEAMGDAGIDPSRIDAAWLSDQLASHPGKTPWRAAAVRTAGAIDEQPHADFGSTADPARPGQARQARFFHVRTNRSSGRGSQRYRWRVRCLRS